MYRQSAGTLRSLQISWHSTIPTDQLALYDTYRYIHLINLSTTIRNRLDNKYDSDSALLYCRCTVS